MRNKNSLREASEKWPHSPQKTTGRWERGREHQGKANTEESPEIRLADPCAVLPELALLLNKYVTIVKLLGMSMPQFSQRQNELYEENELMCVTASLERALYVFSLLLHSLPCLPEAAATIFPSAWECTKPQECIEIWNKFLQNPLKPRNRKNLSLGLARWFSQQVKTFASKPRVQSQIPYKSRLRPLTGQSCPLTPTYPIHVHAHTGIHTYRAWKW